MSASPLRKSLGNWLTFSLELGASDSVKRRLIKLVYNFSYELTAEKTFGGIGEVPDGSNGGFKRYLWT